MPYHGNWERDPQKWERCKKVIITEMLSGGWIRKSGKFDEVMTRKANKLYNKTN